MNRVKKFTVYHSKNFTMSKQRYISKNDEISVVYIDILPFPNIVILSKSLIVDFEMNYIDHNSKNKRNTN
jgi:hypothetical protein